MKQIINSIIMMILLSGIACPNSGNWNVPWQKVIPYATAIAGVTFGAWMYKNAQTTAPIVSEEVLDISRKELQEALQKQGIDISFNNQNEVTSIKTKGVSIAYQSNEIDFYCKDMQGGTFRLFNNSFNDNSEKSPIVTINSLIISTFGIINQNLFYLCAKNNTDRWHIYDESRGNLQFDTYTQAQKALDLLVKVD